MGVQKKGNASCQTENAAAQKKACLGLSQGPWTSDPVGSKGTLWSSPGLRASGASAPASVGVTLLLWLAQLHAEGIHFTSQDRPGILENSCPRSLRLCNLGCLCASESPNVSLRYTLKVTGPGSRRQGVMPSATYCPYSRETALSHRTLPMPNWMLITSLPDSGTPPTPSQDPHVNTQSDTLRL